MSCYFLIGVFFSFVYSAHNGCTLSSSGAVLRSSGTVLNYDDPEIKYDFVNKILYSGNGNSSFPFNDALQDVCYLSPNQFIIRSGDKDYTTFALIKDGKECNSFSTFDDSQLPGNQKYIVDAWGAQKRKNKILIAWIEILIQADGGNQLLKNLTPLEVLEILKKKTDDFYSVSAELKIFDISLQLLKNRALSGQVPMSFEIQNFPLSSRFKRFPYKILFSPDSKWVIIQTNTGFVLQPLIPTFPVLQAEIFSFSNVLNYDLTEKKSFFENFTLKWTSNEQFLLIAYTDIVTRFVRYSKYGSAWWGDKEDDCTVGSINQTIEKFNHQEQYLLKLRFGHFNDTLVKLWGIFLGISEEQAIVDISIQK